MIASNRKLRYFVICSAVILSVVASSRSSDSSGVLDKLLTDYKLLKSYQIGVTGKYIELGADVNFSSVDIEVAIYATEYRHRSKFALGEKLATVFPAPDADKITMNFVDGCYEVGFDFDMSRIKFFNPKWFDETSNTTICLRLVSFDRKRVFEEPILK